MDRSEQPESKGVAEAVSPLQAESVWNQKCEPGILRRAWNYERAVNHWEGFSSGTFSGPAISETYQLYNAEDWSDCVIRHKK